MHLLWFLHIKTTARRFSVDNKTFDFNKFIAELHSRVEKFSRKTLSNFDQRALAGYEEFARGNQINERRRKRLNEKNVIVMVISCILQPLTVSKKKIGWSKFGFFCVFLIMEEWMVWPPHSNSILGDETFANWNFFMFLTPQQRT